VTHYICAIISSVTPEYPAYAEYSLISLQAGDCHPFPLESKPHRFVCANITIKPPGDTVIFVRTYLGITPNILLSQNIPLVCLQALACPPSARFGRLGFLDHFFCENCRLWGFFIRFALTES